jgi:hypothetical protein
MTLPTVSDQGFTVHNHICGINFLSHFKGAPQKSTPIRDDLGSPLSTLRQSGMGMGGGRGYTEIANIAGTAKIGD